MHYTCDMKIGASGPGLLELYPFVIFHYFDMHLFSLKDISGNTLNSNFNFCTHDKYDELFVENKIRAIGPGPLELFPFIVLAIKLCIFLNNFYVCF